MKLNDIWWSKDGYGRCEAVAAIGVVQVYVMKLQDNAILKKNFKSN